jgi:putative ABC transport system substrate-binding protein
MKRREFITLLGAVAAPWPVSAPAQQTVPVIGFVFTQSPNQALPYVTAFRSGLGEVGFVEGQNVVVDYRWPGSEYERLPALLAELVHRQVAVIVGNTPPAKAAKTATSKIPIVFFTGTDPVKEGLVASFNRPGGNATGVSFGAATLEEKRLGLLHELLPQATGFAALADPSFVTAANQLRDLQHAARSLGRQIHVVEASTDAQLESGFAVLAQQRPDAVIVAAGPFFTGRRRTIIEMAARHSLPAIYPLREFPADGGLMSYGTSLIDALRQTGVYAGRILRGEKPADLPVVQSTKFELVINLKTARALGLNIPDRLLALADEVIE